MINILLEGYEINAHWLYDDIKIYIAESIDCSNSFFLS